MSDTNGSTGPGDNGILFYALVAVLVLAPLYQGGIKPLALLFLELAAVGLIALVLWQDRVTIRIPRALLVILLVLFLFPLLQLVPLPAGIWSSLPGYDVYAEALQQVNGDEPLTGWRAASLIPFATESAWLTLLPPLAIFLAVGGLPTHQVQILVILFLGIATAQAVLGLIQYGDGPGSLFYLGNPFMAGSAAGTYVNRNHLAGLLEMALPVGLALLAATVGRYRQGSRHHHRSLRNRLARFGSLRANQTALFGTAALAILLGLIFTRSRTGVSLGMLGILLCLVAFSRRLGGNNIYGLVGTFTAAGLGLAVEIGLTPVLGRFAMTDPVEESRWLLFAGTLRGIGEFFPWGSGVGSFGEVFLRFHPVELITDKLASYAHNDYLQWTMEGGFIVIGLMLALFAFYIRQWPRLWSRGIWSPFRFAQVGAGIALLLMILHGFVDFNLHIPANAIFFAFLAAVFFYQETTATTSTRPREPDNEAVVTKRPLFQTIPPENAVNPFDVP